MSDITILAVDDEQDNLDVIKEALEGPGLEILTFTDPVQALKSTQDRVVDIVLTDLRMPNMNGLEVLQQIKTRSSGTEVVLMTAYGEIDQAVQAMKNGAADFLSKPLRLAHLKGVIGKITELQTMRKRLEDLSGGAFAPVGSGDTLRRLLSTAGSVAETDATVLITGETGVGKEVLADFIQKHSARSRGTFVKVNCTALTETLLESELFGHERGAFTGAAERHIGRFERAHKGTLFLDEIGELSPGVQVKLLRVLQNREIERLGGNQAIPVDFRLVCATHRDLESMVNEGKFREDLFYRINVFPIHIPPLRQRLEDIPALAYHFLKRARGKIGRGPNDIAPNTLDRLQQHHWPGNVRELENVIERACVVARGTILQPDDVWWKNSNGSSSSNAVRSPSDPACVTIPDTKSSSDSTRFNLPRGNFAEGGAPIESNRIAAPVAGSNGNGNGHGNGHSNGNGNGHGNGNGAQPTDLASSLNWALEAEDPLETTEKATLKLVLDRCDWNFQVAAERLRLSRSTLYAKAGKYGLKK